MMSLEKERIKVKTTRRMSSISFAETAEGFRCYPFVSCSGLSANCRGSYWFIDHCFTHRRLLLSLSHFYCLLRVNGKCVSWLWRAILAIQITRPFLETARRMGRPLDISTDWPTAAEPPETLWVLPINWLPNWTGTPLSVNSTFWRQCGELRSASYRALQVLIASQC